MSTDAIILPDDPAQLKALVLRERERYEDIAARHEQFTGEHARFTAQHEQLVAEYESTVQSKQRTIQQMEATIMLLMRRLQGHKQERVDPDQLMLFEPKELEELAEELRADKAGETATGTQTTTSPRRGHGRRRLPKDLPRERKLYELSPQERACPCCGEVRQEIGSETSEQLEYEPAVLKVIEHVRVKYACRHCQEHVAIAAKPPQPIQKGLPGPGLMAQVVLGKYGDHVPLYRHEDIFARHGVVLRRSTLCGWIAAAADLAEPLYERMKQRVLSSFVIHTDDTSVKLLDFTLHQARTARFWAYIGDGRNPYSVYDFTDSRSRDGPQKFLQGFSGYLQADAYGGYDGIYLGSRGDSRGGVLEVACWAHCRRYWWQARDTASQSAHQALSFITRLYQLEHEFAGLDDAARGDARQKHSLPILNDFRTWLDQQPAPLPKSFLGKAWTYTLNQWTALNRYCEDGRLTIDNNISERTVKIVAMGRKNWLFVASKNGGRRAAILFSLVASCKANQVEPWAYLRDLFTHLPDLDTSDPATLDPLLPDAWLTANPTHRWHIDDLRRRSRPTRTRHRRRKAR